MRVLKEEDKKDFLKKYDLHEYLIWNKFISYVYKIIT
jgi:hypothetical protein